MVKEIVGIVVTIRRRQKQFLKKHRIPSKKEKPKSGSKETEKLVRRLEREIDRLEQELKQTDEALSAASSDYQELMRLTAVREEQEAQLNQFMEQWEAAASQLES